MTRHSFSLGSLGLIAALAMAACGSDAGGTPGGDIDASPGGGVQATFTSLYGDYFQNCKQCHAPGAPGATSDIEKTLDFSTQTTAYATLKGIASGLSGNFMGCNGVPFIGSTPGMSLVVAVLDQSTRQTFDVAAFPNCDMDAIPDETVKVGSQPSSDFLTALEGWIGQGAPNN